MDKESYRDKVIIQERERERERNMGSSIRKQRDLERNMEKLNNKMKQKCGLILRQNVDTYIE